jgi:hypothetical protein
MARRQGGTLGGFTPLSTPNAPTGLSVSTSIGSASVSFTAPTDTGDAAVTSYIVTAIDESTGASFGATGSASPITVSPSPGGTFKIRAQAVNGFGPGRLTEFNGESYSSLGRRFMVGGGDGLNGQIGDNNNLKRSSPVQVGALTTWAKVAAGQLHGMAVKTDGTLWTWGYNGQGALGQNDTIRRSSPIQVGALTNWAYVAGGERHTVASTTSGELYAWGKNTRGEVGDGTVVTKSSPVQIGALTNWKNVAAKNSEFCAATKTDGTLWAWGFNTGGQLGDGTVVARSSPVQVGALTNWLAVTAGASSTTAILGVV